MICVYTFTLIVLYTIYNRLLFTYIHKSTITIFRNNYLRSKFGIDQILTWLHFNHFITITLCVDRTSYEPADGILVLIGPVNFLA